jgi:hypothetical protein
MPIQKITTGVIDSIANTQISGNIVSSQITSVANTQITGNIIASQVTSISANTQITGILPLANGGTGTSLGAWTSYTPGITAESGSFNAVSATGQYQLIGKTCFVNMNITYSDRGTATGGLYATLPFTSAARIQIGGYGMEVNSTGYMLKGYIPASSTQLQIKNYSNGSVLTSGYQPIMTVVYEIA